MNRTGNSMPWIVLCVFLFFLLLGAGYQSGKYLDKLGIVMKERDETLLRYDLLYRGANLVREQNESLQAELQEAKKHISKMEETVVSSGTVSFESYNVSVPKTTLEELIIEGKYDCVNSEINSHNFPAHSFDFGEKEVILVSFDRVMTYEKVTKFFEQMDLRPVTAIELVALGNKFPKIMKQTAILALGAVWCDPYGCRLWVPDLWQNPDEQGRAREKFVGYKALDWRGFPKNSKFPAIRLRRGVH